METVRRVAVLGGNRIPFARSNGRYANASNQDLLTAALDGLVARFGLAGQRLGEVVAGAVLKHSRDFNLTREVVLGSRLDPHTPGVRPPAGLRHRPGGRHPGRQQDRPRADRRRHRRRRRTPPPTRRWRSTRSCGVPCCELNAARTLGARLRAAARAAPDPAVRARDPAQRRTAYRAVHGRARGDHRAALGHRAARPRTRWRSTRTSGSPPRTSVGSSTTWSPPTSGLTRDENLRADTTLEKLGKLKPVFGTRAADAAQATMTAGNSSPLTDGASTVLLASEEWAAAHHLPVLAWFSRRRDRRRRLRTRRRGAADGPGVRGAAAAGPRRADAAGLRLLRDPRGVRLAGAGHPGRLGVAGVLPERAGPGRAARLDRPGQAQRQRLVAGRRAPVRRHRRPHRGHPGQAARRDGAPGAG